MKRHTDFTRLLYRLTSREQRAVEKALLHGQAKAHASQGPGAQTNTANDIRQEEPANTSSVVADGHQSNATGDAAAAEAGGKCDEGDSNTQAVTDEATEAARQAAQEAAAMRARAARGANISAARMGTGEMAWRLGKVRRHSAPTVTDIPLETLLQAAHPEVAQAQGLAHLISLRRQPDLHPVASCASKASHAATPRATPTAQQGDGGGDGGPLPGGEGDALAPLASHRDRDLHRPSPYGRRWDAVESLSREGWWARRAADGRDRHRKPRSRRIRVIGDSTGSSGEEAGGGRHAYGDSGDSSGDELADALGLGVVGVVGGSGYGAVAAARAAVCAREVAELCLAGKKVLQLWEVHVQDWAATILQAYFRARTARYHVAWLAAHRVDGLGLGMLPWGPLGSPEPSECAGGGEAEEEGQGDAGRLGCGGEGGSCVWEGQEEGEAQCCMLEEQWNGEEEGEPDGEDATEVGVCAEVGDEEEEEETKERDSPAAAAAAMRTVVQRALRQQARDVLLAIQAQRAYSRVRTRLLSQAAQNPRSGGGAPRTPRTHPAGSQPATLLQLQPLREGAGVHGHLGGSGVVVGSLGGEGDVGVCSQDGCDVAPDLSSGPAPSVDHGLWGQVQELGIDPFVVGAGERRACVGNPLQGSVHVPSRMCLHACGLCVCTAVVHAQVALRSVPAIGHQVPC